MDLKVLTLWQIVWGLGWIRVKHSAFFTDLCQANNWIFLLWIFFTIFFIWVLGETDAGNYCWICANNFISISSLVSLKTYFKWSFSRSLDKNKESPSFKHGYLIKIIIIECNNFTNNIYCNHVTDEYSIIKFSWMRLLQHAH